MLLTTVEELRESRATKTPLYAVVWLAYSDSPNNRPKRGYGYGRDEDIFTTRNEAQARFTELATEAALVEECTFSELRYGANGGWTWWPLDEWKDKR